MDYIAVSLLISPSDPFNDLITFRLGEAGFEMFEDQPGGILAYIKEAQFNEDALRSILDECRELECNVDYSLRHIPWQNWNESWEKNFNPEVISDRIYVRARFHPPAPEYPIELIVEPRMAFGTGHHPTTRQMLEQMLLLDFDNKSVLDMGCGTGILGILAAKLGATEVLGIDNDPNSAEISAENAIENHVPFMECVQGDANNLRGEYDIILANINRNIIINDLDKYVSVMKHEGQLLTSGYYLDDLEAIKNECNRKGLKYIHHSEQDNWCCALFIKP